MNILFTLDENYLQPMQTLLCSILVSNPGEHFDVYLISDNIRQESLSAVQRMLSRCGGSLHLISAGSEAFAQAPTVRYYSRAMYYRLLAGELLPQSLDRILYLDPDMLVTGPLRPLYETPLNDKLYAACIHRGLINISGPVNKLRLSTYEAEGYYNSGMLLMNLPLIRQRVRPDDIFSYVHENRQLLVLPDQDVLNALYGEQILPLDELRYNYNARKYREYLLTTQGKADINWVMANTCILHFCGKVKPWKKTCRSRFAALYRHYMHLAEIYLSA